MRFATVVEKSGRPDIHLMLVVPEKDLSFQRAMKANRVMTTKAFVLSFSEGLATELKETGVTLTALCPGPTDTDFFPKADMLGTRAFQQANLIPPQDVAEAGYKAFMAGDRVIVPGFANKAMVFMRRIIPESLQAKMNEFLTDNIPPEDQKRERGEQEAKG